MSAIHAALVEAQKVVGVVAHDARNDHHGYGYASAEAMIEAGKRALNENGLAFTRIDASIVAFDAPLGGAVAKLRCQYLLVHGPTGETLPYQAEFPIVPEKGRPLDKASAASDTECEGYALRGLLQIARRPKGHKRSISLDVSGRDDRGDGARQTPSVPRTAERPVLATKAPQATQPSGAMQHPLVSAILSADTLEVALVELDAARKDRTCTGFEQAMASRALRSVQQAQEAGRPDWLQIIESKIVRASLSAGNLAPVREAINTARAEMSTART